MLFINSLRRKSFHYHKVLAYVGAVGLIILTLSASTHLLMTWTGPQGVQFYPPQTILSPEVMNAVPSVLEKNNVHSARVVKIVAGKDEPLLQITTDETMPRTYYSLKTGLPIENGDEKQARFLASYYSGLAEVDIQSVNFETEFSDAYPWVNRLLPVYKVQFNTPDHLTLYVHTELNALGNITNTYKTGLQWIFRNFHTFSFLDGTGSGRVFVLGGLLCAVLGMVLTGITMIFTVKKRHILDKKRYTHRLLACIVWFPLLSFIISGLYHLLFYAYADTSNRGMRLSPEMQFHQVFNSQIQAIPSMNVNSLTLIQYHNQFYYRLSPAVAPMNMMVHRHQRYEGRPSEKMPVYIQAETGEIMPLTDEQISNEYARAYKPDSKIQSNTVTTSFGMGYDFRNKRLPVREISLDTSEQHHIFIDPATGILVDQTTQSARYEGLSFSFLHKWNFLYPLTGRGVRDSLMAVVLVLTFIPTILGLIMMFTRRKRRQS